VLEQSQWLRRVACRQSKGESRYAGGIHWSIESSRAPWLSLAAGPGWPWSTCTPANSCVVDNYLGCFSLRGRALPQRCILHNSCSWTLRIRSARRCGSVACLVLSCITSAAHLQSNGTP
jgi:hypothetical protein